MDLDWIKPNPIHKQVSCKKICPKAILLRDLQMIQITSVFPTKAVKDSRP